MASLIDTHAHLDFDKFDDDREEVIARAFESGIEAIVTVGTDPVSWEKVWRICESQDHIFPALGYHANDLNGLDEGSWPELVEWLKAHRPVAIGEIGLDYYWDTVPPEKQHDYFRRQLALAREMDLPVVVHCRDAHEDCLAALEDAYPSGARGVMHCFSGDRQIAEQAVRLGMHLSFAGPVTYNKSDDLREAAKWAPLGRILVETDCPFLAPQPRRGKRNEPAFVRFTAEKLAEIREMSFDELAGITTANARRLFQI